ncbi:MAG: S-layer homology domain-containing protein [Clostridiales bacterium]|nr:S-layer homology domain-containing protein [Clostridiales bacterium]
MRKLKRVLSVVLVLCMLLSLVVVSSSAATDYEITLPTEAMDTEGSNVLTTLAQRASSEIPLIFGLNVIGGNMFSGLQDVGGTSVNENPDPYVWNYNYLRNVLGLDAGTGVMSSLSASDLAAQTLLPEGTYYVPLGNTLTNSNGLYSSGGANQSYGVAVDELGGMGYAVGYRTDVIIGFNSNIVDQIEWVQNLVEGDEYYEEGDEDYSPLIIDVQTGSVTSRLYAWTEMGQAISAYLDEHEDLTTRYDDPYAIGVDVEEFSAGIPYYIASLIADGTIEKKTAAYISAISDNLFTCVDPGTVGNVGADVYAEVNNFNFIEGTGMTLTDLMALDVDVIILGASGYSYNGSTSTSGASGSTQGSAGDKADILIELADLGYSSDEVPLVMDSNTISVQIGTNGYNYSPITPMFVPYVQVYAYMEELAEVNSAINPAAMVEFMFNELCHVSDESSRDVALYYIGTNWDAVDDEYDTVPDIENYTYDEDAIIEAINVGIEYALSGEAEANGNTLLAAYRTSENAYIILTEYLTSEKTVENDEYISLVDTNNALGGGAGETYYLDVTALYNAATTGTESDMGTNESGSTSQFQDVDTSYAQIIDYYNSGEYGYGDDLQDTLQNYLTHMVEHVWDPSDLLSVEGTYGFTCYADDGETVQHTAGTTVSEYVAATCTEDAREDAVTYCSVCGAEMSRETTTTYEGTKTGHTAANPVYKNVVAATCTTDGSYNEVVYCQDCGELMSTASKTTEKLSSDGTHTWDSGEVTKEATCTEDGELTYTCTVCGETETEAIPATGHTWDEGTVTAAATCTTMGTMTYTCTDCGETKTELYALPVAAASKACTRAEFVTTLWLSLGSPEVESTENPFTDISEDDYYYAAVLWAYENGITSGTSETTFSPDDSMSRAQAVTMLYRYDMAYGEHTASVSTSPFTDISENDYYYDAVLWAYGNEITCGTSATTFSPNNTISLAEWYTFLYRYMGSPAVETAENPFLDISGAEDVDGSNNDVSYDALLWAYEAGVLVPVGHIWDETEIKATRYTEGSRTYTCSVCGESYTETIDKLTGSDAEFLFGDVSAETSYYYKAVYWAYDLGITTGTSATAFSPDEDCTRAQFATFVYRLAEVYGYDMTLSSTTSPFSDVDEDTYEDYYIAILWCYQNGIIKGTTAPTDTAQGVFSLNDTIERQQAVLILYRMFGEEVDSVSPFSDVVEGSTYSEYYEAALWAYSAGVTTGTTAPTVDDNGAVTAQGVFSGSDNCLRSEMITFLYRCGINDLV